MKTQEAELNAKLKDLIKKNEIQTLKLKHSLNEKQDQIEFLSQKPKTSEKNS